MAYINQKELDALQHAIDFISSNTSGCDEEFVKGFKDLQSDLNSIWKKGINDRVVMRHRRKFKRSDK